MDIRRTIATTLMAVGGGLAVCGLLPGAVGAESSTQQVGLHNATSQENDDCPNSTDSWWHFVVSPNNGTFAFTLIHLNIGGSGYDFSGGSIVKNGSQGDNVFVKVPGGYEITDLVKSGSYALITPGSPAVNGARFNLSHTCTPDPEPTTTTTDESTTTTTDDEVTTTTSDEETTTTEGDTDESTTTTDGESEPPPPPTTECIVPVGAPESVCMTTTTDGGFDEETNTTPPGFDSRGLLPTTGGEVAALVVLGLVLALTGGVIRVTGHRRTA